MLIGCDPASEEEDYSCIIYAKCIDSELHILKEVTKLKSHMAGGGE